MNVSVNMTALTTPRTHPTLSIYKCEHRTFCHNLVHYECVNTHLLVWTWSHTLYQQVVKMIKLHLHRSVCALTSDILIVDPSALLGDMEAYRKENETYPIGDA